MRTSERPGRRVRSHLPGEQDELGGGGSGSPMAPGCDLFADTRMAEPEFVRPSLQAALQDLGYTFGRAEEVLTARPPTVFEAETLALDPGEWIVQVVRISYSTEDTPGALSRDDLRSYPALVPHRPGSR